MFLGVLLMSWKFSCSHLLCFADDVSVIPRVFLICIQILDWIYLFGVLVWFSSWLAHFRKQITCGQVLLFTILFQIEHSWLLHARFHPLRRLQEEMRRWHVRLHRLLSETFVDLTNRGVDILSILFARTSNLVLILLLLLNQFYHILMFRFCFIWIDQIQVFLVLIPLLGGATWLLSVVAHILVILRSLQCFKVLCASRNILAHGCHRAAVWHVHSCL